MSIDCVRGRIHDDNGYDLGICGLCRGSGCPPEERPLTTFDPTAARELADRHGGSRHPGAEIAVAELAIMLRAAADEVDRLLAVESMLRLKERAAGEIQERLAAENVKLRADRQALGDLAAEKHAELRLARAVVEAARYDRALGARGYMKLCEAITAYDAHIAEDKP